MTFFCNFASAFARLVSGFIPNKVLRKKVRASLNIQKKGETAAPYIINKNYGKIYYPQYSKSAYQGNDPYDIYNNDGQKMETFFIRDVHTASMPYKDRSKYFIYDRFNFGLDVHFYVNLCMLEQMGNPKKRYGMFMEPETIEPEAFKIFDWNKGLEKDFDLIFTYTERFLDKFDNARFFPYFARVWHKLEDENGNLPKNWYDLKTKDVSIVSSDKTMCDLHKFRLELARKCKREGLADTFGTFDGGKLIPIKDSLDNYRFSIAIENLIDSYWYTEKIINCFATMTIPIYCGATKIDKFFNPDGIIKISPSDFDNIDKILKKCTKEEYDSRIEAVRDNYNRAKKYENINDWLYEEYLMEDLKK